MNRRPLQSNLGMLPRLAVVILLETYVFAADLRIVALGGERAINSIREKTGRDITVKIERDGRPVPGAVVTFVLPEIGPSGYFAGGVRSAIVHSGSDGVAVARGLRANNVAGNYHIRVTASDSGDTAVAAVEQSNVAPAQAARGPSKKAILIGVIAAAAAGGIVAATHAGGSNGNSALQPASTTAAGAVITPGAPSFGPPR